MSRTTDVIVLGAGPAGLGATLALARAGAAVTLVDAGPRPGGLCVTRRGDGVAYDIGGHIPFVRDAQRLEWLRELVGDDLCWVPRPVVCVRDGRIVPGRYLDQRPPSGVTPAAADGSARGELGRRVGAGFVDLAMRPYLEKIDGVPLERIPAERARRLLEDQAAPRGFHFPAHGIGQLMDAMATAARRAGADIRTHTRVTSILVPDGRAEGAEVTGPSGAETLRAPSMVIAMPAGMAAGLCRPAAPPEALGQVRMRGVCIVYLEVSPAQPFAEAWVQVDDPSVPFARAFAPANWSPHLVAGDRTVFGLECYCQAEPDDPVWRRDDAALTADCAHALVDTLGWVAPDAHIAPIEVVRLPRAYPLPDLRQVGAVRAPAVWLGGLHGVHHAPGAAVIEAIEGGERAAAAALDPAVPV